ncbi:MAG: PIN domain-containing protein [Hormoscilla sp.]
MNQTALPDIILLFDVNGILDKTTREWSEYSRVGTCYLPQVVYDEIRFLCDRASEPELEKPAREFIRFHPESNWQLTDARATHPSLTDAPGQAQSKKARLNLAVAECACGLAQEMTDKLIVLVSNTQPLLQQMQALTINNLCGITTTALLQWSRTSARPPAVTQQLQAIGRSGVSTSGAGPSAAAAPRSTQPARKPALQQTGGPASARKIPKTKKSSSLLVQLISSSIGLVILLSASFMLWRLIQPQSFDRFWQQQVVPLLPANQNE